MLGSTARQNLPVTSSEADVPICEGGDVQVNTSGEVARRCQSRLPRERRQRRAAHEDAAVGSGLRAQTPVGPLAVDYGFDVTRKSYEDIGAIDFAIGLF